MIRDAFGRIFGYAVQMEGGGIHAYFMDGGSITDTEANVIREISRRLDIHNGILTSPDWVRTLQQELKQEGLVSVEVGNYRFERHMRDGKVQYKRLLRPSPNAPFQHVETQDDLLLLLQSCHV